MGEKNEIIKHEAQNLDIKFPHNSKLTEKEVLEIYDKMNNGVNYKDVMREYGVGQCLVYKIKRKEHWVFYGKTRND